MIESATSPVLLTVTACEIASSLPLPAMTYDGQRVADTSPRRVRNFWAQTDMARALQPPRQASPSGPPLLNGLQRQSTSARNPLMASSTCDACVMYTECPAPLISTIRPFFMWLRK